MNTIQTSGKQGNAPSFVEENSVEATDILFREWDDTFTGDVLYGFMDEQYSLDGLM